MKLIAYFALAVVTASPALAEGFSRITTKAEYIENVVGKNGCNDSGCAKALKNGKMKGKFGALKFRGTWEWRDQYLCRSGKLGDKDLGTDCQVIEISGNKLRITRNKGEGKSVEYTIQ